MKVNGEKMPQKNIQWPKKVKHNILIEKTPGLKMNGKNQIISNGLKMPHKNIQLLRKVQNNIHTEKMLGQRMNGKNQTISSGSEMLQKNIQLPKNKHIHLLEVILT